MPSVSVAVVEVPAPIEAACSFLANLENAAAWWPLVVGSVNQPVRALRRACAGCTPRAATVLPHLLRTFSLALAWQLARFHSP
jgi:hypothetical protein